MIMNTRFEEHVNGQIIGSYMLTGQLFCNGRKQGQTLSAETDEAMKAKAEEYIAERKAECGEVYKLIFPGEWELRIYN